MCKNMYMLQCSCAQTSACALRTNIDIILNLLKFPIEAMYKPHLTRDNTDAMYAAPPRARVDRNGSSFGTPNNILFN